MKRLAVLISNAGTGSNLQAIIDAIGQKKINGKIVIVISDTADAYGLQRARKHGIQTHILKSSEDITRILQDKYHADYICLGGWKKVISDAMLQVFYHKILNIHPGLIPDTMKGSVANPDGTAGVWNRGKFTEKAVKNFFDNHATYAGCSVHFLTKEFDFGPVLARSFEKIRLDDTVDSLYDRLKKKEHMIYIEALQKLCNG